MNTDNTRVRAAIDAYFSDLDARPSLQSRVLARARGKNAGRRRLSAGLILAIALVLLAAGALAAVLLSMRQLVEDKAVPMANRYEGDAYTPEDTNALLRLARENGITLSERAQSQIQKALDMGEGYFKEELLMALAKAEFGDAPQAWTLEQQKWFDDVCVAIGFIPQGEKGMPAGGEDAKSAIIQAANAHIRAAYDPAARLDDPAWYRVGAQYINGDVDGEYPGMYWSIDYQPLSLGGAEYWVYLRDDASILGDVNRPGFGPQSTVRDIRDGYNRYYGTDETWAQSTLRAFRDTALQTADTNAKAYLALARTTYPDIPDNALSRERAHALAASHVGFDAEKSHSHIFLIGDTPNPVWKVTLIQDTSQWFVELDCLTGEVKTALPRESRDYGWWKRIVLCDVFLDVEKNWTDDRPPVG